MTPTDRALSGLRIAGLVFVGAWLIGLLVAPSAPSPDAPDAEVQAFFVDNDAALLIQALLVHGVAGVAFGAFVIALRRALRDAGPRWAMQLMVDAGLAAAAISLVQLGLEISANPVIAGEPSTGTAANVFEAVNIADLLKAVLIGIAVATAGWLALETNALPRWVGALGCALLPILVAGGLSFVIDSDSLTALLGLSLVLLLIWTLAVSVMMPRRDAATMTP